MSEKDSPQSKTPNAERGSTLWSARAPSGSSPLSVLSRGLSPASVDGEIAVKAAERADDLARPFARAGGVQELGDIFLD